MLLQSVQVLGPDASAPLPANTHPPPGGEGGGALGEAESFLSIYPADSGSITLIVIQ